MQSRELERKRLLKRRNSFLDKFAGGVEGFNQRALGIVDLEFFCLQHDIEIDEMQFRALHGIAVAISDCDYIYINSLISYPEKVIAGYHELFHLVQHIGTGDSTRCLSEGQVVNLSKNEFQAQAAGVIALMPDALVDGMSVEDMMREFEVSRRIAEFRLRLVYG
jgi:Zn-dependent peptidase ImmA (M78 family)